MFIRLYGKEWLTSILFKPNREGTTYVHKFVQRGMWSTVIDMMIDELGFNDNQLFEGIRPKEVPEHVKLSSRLLMRVECKSLLATVCEHRKYYWTLEEQA